MLEEQKSSKITIFSTPSFGVLSIAFLIMLVAKCFNYADLSWWIVTAPLWAPWALCVGFFVGFYALAFVALVFVGILAITFDGIDRIYIKIKNAFKKKES